MTHNCSEDAESRKDVPFAVKKHKKVNGVLITIIVAGSPIKIA